MKLIVLVLVCIYWVYADEPTSAELPVEGSTSAKPPIDLELFRFNMKGLKLRYFEQPVDHFNIFDNRTWKMRYLVKDNYFKPGAPLFLEIGGEQTMNEMLITQGQLPRLAEEFNGLLVHTEHRYYGKSLPFGRNFSTPNMRWLNAEQGLEDLVALIEYLKETTPGLKDSKVVVQGCSYPGMLATWIRIKYPHIVDISYASSAPVEIGMEYPGYYNVVSDVYANISTKCLETIKDGFRELKEKMITKDGLATVRKLLKTWSCGNVYQMPMVSILGQMFSMLNVQSDVMEYEQLSCLALTMGASDTPAYERLIKMMIVKSRDQCFQKPLESDEEPEAIEEPEDPPEQPEGEAPPPEEEGELDSKAWRYQSCVEQAAFPVMSADSDKNFLGEDSPLQDFINRCISEFGPEVNAVALERSVKAINRRYGARHPVMTKVLSVQGLHDPWREFGLMESLGPEAPVILIDGQHCVDVYEPTENDPPSLVKARDEARAIIGRWLREIL